MKKLIIFFLIIIFSNVLLLANEAPEITLANPQNTITVHLSYLQPDLYKPELAAKTLNVDNPASKQSQKLARQLKQILDDRQLFVILDKVSKDPNYYDSTRKSHVYVLFDHVPEIYLEKVGDKWLYSEETIEKIPDLLESTYIVNINSMVDHLPSFMHNNILGMYIWQYVGFIFYLIIGYIFYRILAWIFGYFIIRLLLRFSKEDIVTKYIKPLARPLSFLIVLIIGMLFLSELKLPVMFGFVVKKIYLILIPALITLIAYRLVELITDILMALASKTQTNVDDSLIPLLRKTMKVIVVVFGVIFILQNLDVSITPLLAGVSIGGLALALAAQDTVKNLFGSITIFTDQPFEVGDWIVIDGAEGTVEEVGIRSTRIRTFYNSVVSIPNGKLADMKIDNMGRRKFRRYVAQIGITYDTPPDLIDAFVDGLREILMSHPDTNKENHQIHLNDFGDSAILILFYIFFDAKTWSDELKARHEVISQIIRLAQDIGVRFAFPTQTVHIEGFPEKKSLTPQYNESKDEFYGKMKAYFNKNKKES